MEHAQRNDEKHCLEETYKKENSNNKKTYFIDIQKKDSQCRLSHIYQTHCHVAILETTNVTDDLIEMSHTGHLVPSSQPPKYPIVGLYRRSRALRPSPTIGDPIRTVLHQRNSYIWPSPGTYWPDKTALLGRPGWADVLGLFLHRVIRFSLEL